MTHAAPTAIERAWLSLAPKLVAFFAGGLTPALLISIYSWFATQFGWAELSPVLAALVVTALATIAGWFKSDGALAGLTWNQIAPKLLTLAISSGIITTLVAIGEQFGLILPPWVAALAAVIVPLIPGYIVSDKRAGYALAA